MKRIAAFILIFSLLCVGAATYADGSISDTVPVSTLSAIPLYDGLFGPGNASNTGEGKHGERVSIGLAGNAI